eukprot:UN22958
MPLEKYSRIDKIDMNKQIIGQEELLFEIETAAMPEQTVTSLSPSRKLWHPPDFALTFDVEEERDVPNVPNQPVHKGLKAAEPLAFEFDAFDEGGDRARPLQPQPYDFPVFDEAIPVTEIFSVKDLTSNPCKPDDLETLYYDKAEKRVKPLEIPKPKGTIASF